MNKGKDVKIGQIVKQFWYSVRDDKIVFFVPFLLFFISQVIGVISPLYYKRFFDVLGKTIDKPTAIPVLVSTLIIILVLRLIGQIFWSIGTYIYTFMQSNVMARLKQRSFNYLVHHSYNFFSNNFTGSLIQKIGRFSRAFEALTDSFAYNIMPLTITVVGSVFVTWFIAPIVSVVILLWVIFFLIFNLSYSIWKMKYNLASAEADSRTTAYLSDAITNNNAISLFNGYAFEHCGFKNVSDDQARKTCLSWRLGSLIDAVQMLLIGIVEFFVFYFSVKYWAAGIATIGTFVLVQTYILGLAQQLWGLSKVIRHIYESIADSKEMVEILIMPHEIKNLLDAGDIQISKGEIVFKNVSFNFNENRKVLDDLNLIVKSGEKLAIIGPSGAGKTTLVRLIMRFYDVTSGNIFVDNQDINKITQESLREVISLVPQDPILFHRTLMENIRYGRREATDDEVREAARLAHCDEFIDVLPLKYETFVGERGIKLSGGERQRIAIARAILKRAPILILDEATSSLDSHSENLIQDAFDNLMKNCTTIVIAHRLSTIRKMDRIIAMKDGRIIEEGTHEELSNKKSGLYQKLWNLQAGGFIQK